MKYLLLSSLLLTSMVLAQEAPPKKDVPKDPKDELKKEEAKNDDALDVEKTASRIAENAQKVGERLKGKDTGTTTRKLQQDILKDIDALLRKAQQPPPPSPPMMEMNPMMPPPPMNNMDPMMNMNMGGMSGMPMPKMNMGMGGMPMGMNMGMGTPPPMGQPKMPMGMGMSGGLPDTKPQGSQTPQGNGRRPKRERKGDDEGPMPKMPLGMNEPLPKGMNDVPPTPGKLDPKEGMGAKKDMGEGDQFGKGPPKRKDDSQFADLYKNVWGHLPDRLRQEMDLYYRDQFMPRYSELLRQYYAAIAEQKKKGDGDR